jgi:rSAM-associated Gly-rich repeat protein
MAQDRRSARALAALLPAGAFGLSVSLASADAAATASPDTGAQPKKPGEVAERLQSIRLSVSDALQQYAKDGEPFVAVDPEKQLAWWGNGWHNGGWGWHNGGWHNGGWGNGWHNGGWGNGWHNGGWGNGWHNW